VYTLTVIQALRSNRRIIVVTVLTCKSSPTSLLNLDMTASTGIVIPFIVGALTGHCAQLTGRNGV
jgi:hypothetical protein